jgi:hypothetical protein
MVTDVTTLATLEVDEPSSHARPSTKGGGASVLGDEHGGHAHHNTEDGGASM